MFTEPQSVTTNAVADSLNRTSFDPEGVFHNASTGRKLRIAHSRAKRARDTVRLDFTKTAADPLLTGVNRQYSMSVYLVIDAPLTGFTATEIGHHAQALTDWLDVPGNLTKVINGES